VLFLRRFRMRLILLRFHTEKTQASNDPSNDSNAMWHKIRALLVRTTDINEPWKQNALKPTSVCAKHRPLSRNTHLPTYRPSSWDLSRAKPSNLRIASASRPVTFTVCHVSTLFRPALRLVALTNHITSHTKRAPYKKCAPYHVVSFPPALAANFRPRRNVAKATNKIALMA
jgi:hypothetical protein